MIELKKCNRLLDTGYSILTVGENKVPNGAWKPLQNKPYSKDEFEQKYLDPKTKAVGIVTGFNNVECIDIDLKVFHSLKEQQDFWNEYLSLLRDNIDDFDAKFVIYKTVNNGYHIIYRCEQIGGNTKLAKLKGYTEAVIETRGVGGYIFVYENQVSNLSYNEIKEISILDREVLMSASRTYDYKGDEDTDKPKESEYKENTTPWDDYNSKTTCHDLLDSDFSIVRNLNDKYVIRRDGATSPHSGYIYKDSGCMYLFTTGTIYPNEKLISPFAMYAHKYHNGDFRDASRDLYQKGFGSRIVERSKVLDVDKPKIPENIEFPIDIFPPDIQTYILESNKTLNLSIDYMGCSLLWMVSVIVGNSICVEIRNGWIENSTVWISVVGKAGIGKTPSINQIIFPLTKVNNREIKRYIKQYDKFYEYEKLSKEEKKDSEEIKRPRKTQFIVNDITLEALVDMHEENKNSVGVFKDELAGWFKDMNKYRAGSDLEFWLSSWSGKGVSLNRKTAKSSFVEKPLIPVLGGIQPSIFDQFNTDENKDNGFIDRMLLSYPELYVDMYNEKELDKGLISWYESYIVKFYDHIKLKLVKFNNEDEIEPMVVPFSEKAQETYKKIFNEITTKQNDENENEYMKSMLPKQKAYVARFALLLNCLNAYDSNETETPYELIMENSMNGAEKLHKYFVDMAKKVKIDSNESKELKSVIYSEKGKSKGEVFKAMYTADPSLNKKKIADMMEVSRTTIYSWIKELEK